MRNSAVLWVLVTLYFAAMGVLYLAVSQEAVGATLLLFGSLFGGLVAGWLVHATRTVSAAAVPVEDRAGADIADGVGVVGEYPTASLRPLAIGIAMTGILLGVAVGLWMTYASVAILGSQVILLTRDADR